MDRAALIFLVVIVFLGLLTLLWKVLCVLVHIMRQLLAASLAMDPIARSAVAGKLLNDIKGKKSKTAIPQAKALRRGSYVDEVSNSLDQADPPRDK